MNENIKMSAKNKNKNIVKAWFVDLKQVFDNRKWVDYVFFGVFLLLIVLAATVSDTFITQRNISNLFRQIVTNGLLSLGMLIVIMSGGIDLSVGPVVALTGILVSGLQMEIPLGIAIPVAIAVGGLVGLINGFMIARFKLQPFIVTLATLGIIRGAIYVYSETPITPTDPTFRNIFGGTLFGVIPSSVIIMLVSFVIIWFFVNRTTAGRAILAIGGNEEAVRLAGVNITSHKILAYVISGLCAGVAGVLLAARVGISQPSIGAGFELDAIAATVIGGAVMGGGGGSVIGTFGGVLTLGLVDNLLNLFGVQTYYQQILKGLIILFAVLARVKEK